MHGLLNEREANMHTSQPLPTFTLLTKSPTTEATCVSDSLRNVAMPNANQNSSAAHLPIGTGATKIIMVL